MNIKNKLIKYTTYIILTLTIIIFSQNTVYADGWLDYVQDLTLGDAVSGSIKNGDFKNRQNGSNFYWHIYKFSMPKDGLLNIYLESSSSEYLTYNHTYNGFTIFSGSNPDQTVWCSSGNTGNKIARTFSSSREVYYGSTDIALSQGEYYFAVQHYGTNNEPYYLTLSYKEPVINVTSISLNPAKMTMEAGDMRTLNATVLPNNATNKTIIWKSTNPSVASIDNGTITAISNGTASIIASSSDGEISAACAVTVSCCHNYETSVTPANTKSNGRIVESCTKCGGKKSRTVYKIKNVNLSKTSYVYNGKTKRPSISIIDDKGNYLTKGKDYKITYPGNAIRAGIYKVSIKFCGSYNGTIAKQFKILPKPTSFTGIMPKKFEIALKWKKTTDDCGYEIVYSTGKNFPKKNSITVQIKKSRTVSWTVSHLKPNRRYFIKIRTFKDIKTNGRTTRLYSEWSKINKVTTKKDAALKRTASFYFLYSILH